MKNTLYKITKALICVLYTGVIYLGGMALVLLILVLYHNKNLQATNFEVWLIVILGAIIAIITDYLAGKFNLIGREKEK
jgi:multisubunit Na+/H+ antiporter MnhB subunit